MDKKKKDRSHRKFYGLYVLVIVFLIFVMVIGIGIFRKTKKRDLPLKKQEQSSSDNSSQTESDYEVYEESWEYGSEWSYESLLFKLADFLEVQEEEIVKIAFQGRTLSSGERVKFSRVGKYSFSVSLKDGTVKNILLMVTDQVPPVIEGIYDREIYVGDSINLLEEIRVTDDVDGEITFEIEGEVNPSKVGTYQIKVRAEDKSGNRTEKEFLVVVKERKTSSKNNGNTNKNSNTNKNTNSNSNTNSNTNSNSNPQPSDPTKTKDGRLQLAKEEAKRVVQEIIKPGMSDREKAIAMYQYLRDSVEKLPLWQQDHYDENHGNEAYAALLMKVASCSGTTRALELLCQYANVKYEYINRNQWDHQFLMVYLSEEDHWIVVDPNGRQFGQNIHPGAEGGDEVGEYFDGYPGNSTP